MFDAGYQKGKLMITRDDIVIRKAILHILDTDHGECILSSALLNPGPEMHDFIRNHIYKIVRGFLYLHSNLLTVPEYEHGAICH